MDISFVVGDDLRGQVTNTAEISRATPVDSSGRTVTDSRTGRTVADSDSTFDSNPNNGDQDDSDSASVNIGHFDLALSTTVAGGVDLAAASAGTAVIFDIAVTNEGTVNATDIGLVNYIPREGLVLADSNWTDNGDGTASLNRPIPGPLAGGRTSVVPITFVVEANAEGVIYNWAEIESADTDADSSTPAPVDVDSRPDNNPRYDSFDFEAPEESVFNPNDDEFVIEEDEDEEGLEDGELTDSEDEEDVDEESGEDAEDSEDDDEESEDDDDEEEEDEDEDAPELIDVPEPDRAVEDDHDAAAVRIEEPVFDLAIQLRLDEDTEVAELTLEDRVDFTISLINEGSVFAADVLIANFLPQAGLTLADGDWTRAGEDLATLALEDPVPPGATIELEVSYIVSNGAVNTIPNTVEIAEATPVDLFGTEVLDEDGDLLADIDSVPFGDLPGNEPGTEDDHSVATITFEAAPIYDLALIAGVADGSESAAFAPGDTITYRLSIVNEGEVGAEDIVLFSAMPEGFSLNGREWEPAEDDDSLTITVDGPVLPGDRVSVLLSFRADTDASGNLDNEVWIGGADLVDEDGDPVIGSNGAFLADFDVADNSTLLELNVIPTLAFNGAERDGVLLFGMALITIPIFAALVWVTFRRRTPQTGVRVGTIGPATSRWG